MRVRVSTLELNRLDYNMGLFDWWGNKQDERKREQSIIVAIEDGLQGLGQRLVEAVGMVNQVLRETVTVDLPTDEQAEERHINGFEYIADAIEILQSKVLGLDALRKELEAKIAAVDHKLSTRMGTLATTEYVSSVKANMEASLRTLSMDTATDAHVETVQHYCSDHLRMQGHVVARLERDVDAMMQHFEKIPARPEETITAAGGGAFLDSTEFIKHSLSQGRSVRIVASATEERLELKLPAAPKRNTPKVT